MPTIRLIPVEEAKQTRRVKEPGIRKQRMLEFDEYARAVLGADPTQAAVFEDIAEVPQKFVLSLRGAFKRASFPEVVVRKMRGRNEVRAWLPDPAEPPAPVTPKRVRKVREAVAV